MARKDELFGHPKGLYILFFTELWERFSYYGMRAILVLFIVASVAEGGLGWTQSEALGLYGFYTMFVYLASIPGGILADRVLGQKKAVMLGGLLLVAGHGVMAIPNLYAFYAALVLIVLGVGCLKPNISTMVGGLYPEKDPRRDKGFTIFYIGINIGAFLAGLLVSVVADEYGWHYGFGLAGIGMLVGQIVYIWGQKYLKSVGNLHKAEMVEDASGKHERPLTKVEKDRIVVLLISFLIVIVFWGAFEQAGGLMNLYANYKTDRFVEMFDYTIPAGVFQSVNSFYIMLFGTAVAGFWAARSMKGKETSTLLKMGVGTIIMGLGFLFMSAATLEVEAAPDAKSSMIWLMLAYLFHTIGELCVSPTAMSFITKLAPVKYASIMMGIYFAATGFGNFLAGNLGEAAQSEPTKIEISKQDFMSLTPGMGQQEVTENLDYFTLPVTVEGEGGALSLITENGKDVQSLIEYTGDRKQDFTKTIGEVADEYDNRIGLIFSLNPVGGKSFEEVEQLEGSIVIQEVQNNQELQVFTFIAIFSCAFGGLLLVFFRKLKKLTHGAEDFKPSDVSTEQGKKVES